MALSNVQQPPSKRPEFFHVTLFEVIQPGILPWPYAWLRPGHFAVYAGELNYPDRLTPANWGWEVSYVNGKSERGEPASLGYSVFLSQDSEWLGKIANWPVRPSYLSSTVRRDRGIPSFHRGLPDPGRSLFGSGLALPSLFPCMTQAPERAETLFETPFGKLTCFSLLRRNVLGQVNGVGYYGAETAMLLGMKVGDKPKPLCSFGLVATNVGLDF